MPNWCEGSLKVRGKKKDILKFFTEGVNAYKGHWENDRYIKEVQPKSECFRVEEDSEETNIYYKDDFTYIEGTKRAFLTDEDRYVCIPNDEPEDKTLVVVTKVSQAWDLRVEDWIDISKKYKLDLKLYGIDKGWGFDRAIEIWNGTVIQNYATTYKNYDEFKWNCPFPWMGG